MRVWRLHPEPWRRTFSSPPDDPIPIERYMSECGPSAVQEAVRSPLRRGRLLRWSFLLFCYSAAAMHASVAPLMSQQAGSCRNGRIEEIIFDNNSVFELTQENEDDRFLWAYRLANSLHARTRVEVIEREILFEVGDCYSPEALEDSERLLREFDFLADAHLRAIPRPGGGVEVIVETRDEWSTRVEPSTGTGGVLGLRGVRLVEDNLGGTGRHLSLFYDRGAGEEIWGVAYRAPQLFRSRWDMGLGFARTEVGRSTYESITFPFVGETGRFAFRQRLERDERYFELLMPDGEELSGILVPLRREQFEVGTAVRRGGARFRHTLIGIGLAGERIEYPGEPVFADVDGRPLALGVLEPTWMPVSSARIILLTGQRNVWFVRRRGLDTIDAVEDVQLGVEAEASIGPTLALFSEDRDVAIGLGLFAGGELGATSIAGGQLSFEARRSYETIPGLPEWSDVLAQVDLWAYYRSTPESPHTFVTTLSGVGGWHPRVPFQLTLGGEAGLRGYAHHVDPGARRIVASFEHRAYLGWPLPELFDAALVSFLDLGKIWPGRVPFGIESPVRASLGVGLRAAFPPGSRQTFRLDVGFPVTRATGFGDLAISIGVGQAIGRRVGRWDPQLLRSAGYRLTTSDFVHPTRRR